MANTNPQAILISNSKLRPLADRLGQLYNLTKALQAEAQAENWLTLFPANVETISDGSDVDGRSIITNQNVRDFTGDITSIINFFEANSNAVRNRVLLIATHPEQF